MKNTAWIFEYSVLNENETKHATFCGSKINLYLELYGFKCLYKKKLWFSQQEYWSGLLFPPPGYLLPDPGIKPVSPALQVDSISELPEEAYIYIYVCVCVCVCV